MLNGKLQKRRYKFQNGFFIIIPDVLGVFSKEIRLLKRSLTFLDFS